MLVGSVWYKINSELEPCVFPTGCIVSVAQRVALVMELWDSRVEGGSRPPG